MYWGNNGYGRGEEIDLGGMIGDITSLKEIFGGENSIIYLYVNLRK